MAPTLYMMPLSPPVRSVLVLAKALDIELNVKFVDLLKGENFKEDYLKMNPQHTVPTLVDEDGYTLWESHAIMAYLISKYGKGEHLYPKDDIKRRATIDQRLHFDSGVIFARGVQISRSIMFGNVRKVTQESIDTFNELYGFLEKFLGDNDWVVGDSLSIADISLGTTVTSWNCLVPFDDFPKIKAWVKKLENLPYFKEANDPGLKDWSDDLSSKLQNK